MNIQDRLTEGENGKMVVLERMVGIAITNRGGIGPKKRELTNDSGMLPIIRLLVTAILKSRGFVGVGWSAVFLDSQRLGAKYRSRVMMFRFQCTGRMVGEMNWAPW